MVASVVHRVKQHRNGLRAAGLRPLQIWVPDVRRPGFSEECKRQSKLAEQADLADIELLDFIDDALSHVEGWIA
jgi:hypothetical protein